MSYAKLCITVPFLHSSVSPGKPLLVLALLLFPAKNLIDRSVGERGDEQVAVRAGQNVRSDSEASAKQQAFAFRDVPFVVIVGNPVLQPRIAEDEVEAVIAQLEAEQVAPQQEVPSAPYNQVALELVAELVPDHKAEAGRGDLELPGQQRLRIP